MGHDPKDKDLPEELAGSLDTSRARAKAVLMGQTYERRPEIDQTDMVEYEHTLIIDGETVFRRKRMITKEEGARILDRARARGFKDAPAPQDRCGQIRYEPNNPVAFKCSKPFGHVGAHQDTLAQVQWPLHGRLCGRVRKV